MVGMMLLSIVYHSPAAQFLVVFPASDALVVVRTPKKLNSYSPWYRPLVVVFIGGTTVALMMYIAAFFYKFCTVYIVIMMLAVVALGLLAYMVNKVTQFIPNMVEAEAVAWLLESSLQQHPELFEKSGHVAHTTQCKVIILNALHHLLPPLIASCT
jgi:hypothetical protein